MTFAGLKTGRLKLKGLLFFVRSAVVILKAWRIALLESLAKVVRGIGNAGRWKLWHRIALEER